MKNSIELAQHLRSKLRSKFLERAYSLEVMHVKEERKLSHVACYYEENVKQDDILLVTISLKDEKKVLLGTPLANDYRKTIKGFTADVKLIMVKRFFFELLELPGSVENYYIYYNDLLITQETASLYDYSIERDGNISLIQKDAICTKWRYY
jgi:hypothetical protein